MRLILISTLIWGGGKHTLPPPPTFSLFWYKRTLCVGDETSSRSVSPGPLYLCSIPWYVAYTRSEQSSLPHLQACSAELYSRSRPNASEIIKPTTNEYRHLCLQGPTRWYNYGSVSMAVSGAETIGLYNRCPSTTNWINVARCREWPISLIP